MLYKLSFFLYIWFCYSFTVAQNSLDIFQIGSVIRIEKQMNIIGKVTGTVTKLNLTGATDLHEKKHYDVKVLEKNGSSISKIEVLVSEDSEEQNMNMIVAGRPNNENNNVVSPLKGLTIVCTNTNGTWEKSILNVDNPTQEQIAELDFFEIPFQYTVDHTKLPKTIKPGYVWNIKKEESAELFGNKDNPFKDGSLKLKLKKEIKSKDEVGYLWDATLLSNGKNVDKEGMNVNVTLKGTMLMTNKNFTMDLTGPVTIQTKQPELDMTLKGPLTLLWKKYQVK